MSLNYPNSEEGKIAESYLGAEVPQMEALKFNSAEPTSWKVLYKADNLSDKNTTALYGKIVKFVKDRSFEKIATSIDIYTMDKNFIVIHGMKTEDHAKGIASILKEFKDYKIKETPYIISNDNYKIVQIKKNFDEWLPIGNGPIVLAPKAPVATPQKQPTPQRPDEENRQRAKENQRRREEKESISDPDPIQNFAPPGMIQAPVPGKPMEKPKR